jgi:hypothetical protein
MNTNKETIDRSKELIFIFENKLLEKDHMIQHLKNELDKYYRNDDSSPKEIIIGDPDKVNLELYNELNYSRELISKISRMLNQEKAKVVNYEKKLYVKIIKIFLIGMRRKNKKFETWEKNIKKYGKNRNSRLHNFI